MVFRSEAAYQRRLVSKLRELFPGCYIFKQDPMQNQGIPDILMLVDKYWVMLEVKLDSTASVRPNQRHYVDKFNDMSFAAFISPDNEEEVLSELMKFLGVD